MAWITLGMKLLPFIVEAVQWVEKFVTEKGKIQARCCCVYGEVHTRYCRTRHQ